MLLYETISKILDSAVHFLLISSLELISLDWWTDHNPLRLVPPTVREPSLPDGVVRETVLADLSVSEREALWGGMDVSRYLEPAKSWDDPDKQMLIGTLINSYRVQSLGHDKYLLAGWPSYLEFEMAPWAGTHTPGDDPSALQSAALCVPGTIEGKRIEILWTTRTTGWSEARSIVLQTVPATTPKASAIALSRLPHFDAAAVDRIRIMFRSGVETTISEPRVLR